MPSVDISFCIPTYNRSSFLQRLLNSILDHMGSTLYEVRVQDNCSTDDTKETFYQFGHNKPNWFYEQNDTNIGGKKNINKCTEKAKGNYILIIGDDDFFNEDSESHLQKVITDLNRNISVKAAFFNINLSNIYVQPTIFKNGFEWLETMGVNTPAFISSVVWEANYWREYSYYKYIEKFHLPQLDCFVEACISKCVIGFKRQLVVQTKAEDTDNPSFWFYNFHALVDCFEYPMLYNKIEDFGTLSFKTKTFIIIRQLKLLKDIYKKVIYFKKNNIEFLITDFAKYHKRHLYWPILYLFLKIVKSSKI